MREYVHQRESQVQERARVRMLADAGIVQAPLRRLELAHCRHCPRLVHHHPKMGIGQQLSS